MLLSDLPPEILLQIFYYVSTIELWKNVRSVCKLFYTTLSNNDYWTHRALVNYGLRMPARLKQSMSNVDTHGELSVRYCEAIEIAAEKWSDIAALSSPKISQIHFATVDATKIFCSKGTKKRLCFTGSRDRSIILWDLDKVFKEENEDSWVVSRTNVAHEGWIWQLCVRDDTELYSVGWDCYLKQWFLTESELVAGSNLVMDTAVLSCLCDGDNILYSSTYTSGPIRCDIRNGLSILDTLKCHGTRSVFSMATGRDTNFVYSVGEDNRLVAVDKRKFTEPVRSWKSENAISRICYSSGYLGVSLRNGMLQFMNPETLEIENNLWVESNSPIKPNGEKNIGYFCTILSKGATFCAYGHKLKAYIPGLAPRLLTSTRLDTLITQMDCYEDCLVAGTVSGVVYFWQ